MQSINVRQVDHAPMVKYVLAEDVNIVARTLYVALVLFVNQQRDDAFAKNISLEIQIIFVFHVSLLSSFYVFILHKFQKKIFLFIQRIPELFVNQAVVRMLTVATDF